MVRLIVAIFLCLAGCAPQPEAEVQAALAPLVEKIEQERAKLAELPADADLKIRFASLYVLDQAPRSAMSDVGRSDLSPEDKEKALGRIGILMAEQDARNLEQVLAYLPPEGWYLKSRYGIEVATTAFLVIQHSNQANWERFVPVLESLVASGEVDGPSFALMFDRLALAQQKPQRYGSQVTCFDGKWQPLPIEEPETVNERRQQIGFNESHEAYVASFARQPCI